jgi:hypothetical protein
LVKRRSPEPMCWFVPPPGGKSSTAPSAQTSTRRRDRKILMTYAQVLATITRFAQQLSPGRRLIPGNRVLLSEGYEAAPAWLAGHEAVTGTVVAFIPGQNREEAAVIELDDELVIRTAAGQIPGVKSARGRFAVLELRHAGQTWKAGHPVVQVELCDFMPDRVRWQDRRQGEWVESHAICSRLS